MAKRIGTLQGETLGQINHLSKRSCNCLFNLFRSIRADGGFVIDSVSVAKFIGNSISLPSSNLGGSLGKTWRNYFTA